MERLRPSSKRSYTVVPFVAVGDMVEKMKINKSNQNFLRVLVLHFRS